MPISAPVAAGTRNYTALHYRLYTGMKGEQENANTKDRIGYNVSAHTGFMKIVQCARERTKNQTLFVAISDINARRVRADRLRI